MDGQWRIDPGEAAHLVEVARENGQRRPQPDVVDPVQDMAVSSATAMDTDNRKSTTDGVSHAAMDGYGADMAADTPDMAGSGADEHRSAMLSRPFSTADRHADLLAQNVRLEDDKVHLREQLAQREQELRDAVAKHEARCSSLEDAVLTRDSRISELTGQGSALESKVREILENGQAEALGLANRIADLVERQHDAEVRIYELQPVAERVPMLEAAVDETKTRLHETEGDLVERDKKLFERERQLADISEDIETIASRPVAGPVFRLLTKGKLRI